MTSFHIPLGRTPYGTVRELSGRSGAKDARGETGYLKDVSISSSPVSDISNSVHVRRFGRFERSSETCGELRRRHCQPTDCRSNGLRTHSGPAAAGRHSTGGHCRGGSGVTEIEARSRAASVAVRVDEGVLGSSVSVSRAVAVGSVSVASEPVGPLQPAAPEAPRVDGTRRREDTDGSGRGAVVAVTRLVVLTGERTQSDCQRWISGPGERLCPQHRLGGTKPSAGPVAAIGTRALHRAAGTLTRSPRRPGPPVRRRR